MTERPILFSAPMVRAILEGRKTQTRRIVKPQPDDNGLSYMPNAPLDWRDEVHGEWIQWKGETPNGDTWRGRVQCWPGDCLWVREASIISPPRFCDRDSDLYNVTDREGNGRICQYLATSPDTSTPVKDYGLKVRPSIHMPRWASRITLEVTEVRAQRLNDIESADAIAEGIEWWEEKGYDDRQDYYRDYITRGAVYTAIESFRTLWNSINLPPKPIISKKKVVAYESYPWSAEDFDAQYPGVREAGVYRGKPITVVPNPWVWAVTFKPLAP